MSNSAGSFNPATAQFQPGQRVRVQPGKGYPPTKYKGGIRYGTVAGASQAGHLPLKSEGRWSRVGEWCYTIRFQSDAKLDCWWSEDALRPAHVKGSIENPPRNSVKEWKCRVVMLDKTFTDLRVRARNRGRAVYHLGQTCSQRKYSVQSITIEE